MSTGGGNYGNIGNGGNITLSVPSAIHISEIKIVFTNYYYQTVNTPGHYQHAYDSQWVSGRSQSNSSNGNSVSLFIDTQGLDENYGIFTVNATNCKFDGSLYTRIILTAPVTASAHREYGTDPIVISGYPYGNRHVPCSHWVNTTYNSFNSGTCYVTINNINSGTCYNGGTVYIDKTSIDPGRDNLVTIHALGNSGYVGVNLTYTYTTNKVYAFPVDNMHQNPFAATDNQDYAINDVVLVFSPDDNIGQCVAFKPINPGLGLPAILIPIEGRPDMVIAIKNTVDN